MRRYGIRRLVALLALPLIFASCGQQAELSEDYEQISSPLAASISITPENAADLPADTKIVVIDPGHGFSDGGTTPPKSFGLDITESGVVLSISQKVKDILQAKEIAVLLTRTSDYDERMKDKMVALRLKDRVELANTMGAVAFVSIHVDAYESSGSPNGYAVYYYEKEDDLSARSAEFSGMLAEGFSSVTGISDVKIWARKKGESFYVNRMTKMPSALFEVGFITNETDARLLADDAWLTKAAQGLADGIEKFVNK